MFTDDADLLKMDYNPLLILVNVLFRISLQNSISRFLVLQRVFKVINEILEDVQEREKALQIVQTAPF